MSEDTGLPEKAQEENGDSGETKRSSKFLNNLNSKTYLFFLLTIVALSIVYCFAFAIPGIKRDALEWEKEKYNREVSKKELQESEIALQKSQNDTLYNACVSDAEDSYWSYIKLNGRPIAKKAGAYSAPMYVWNAADKKKKAALDECYRQYRQ